MKNLAAFAFVGIVAAGFCLGLTSAPQDRIEPKPGVYSVTRRAEAAEFNYMYIEIWLKKAKTGTALTVEGFFVSVDEGGEKLRNISGSLTASGKLRAQYFEGTNKNEAEPLDGHWDFTAGTLLISTFPVPGTVNPLPMKAATSASGDYEGGDWGTVKLRAYPGGLQGSYYVSESDKGTFQMSWEEGSSSFKGKWTGQNGHEGTCEATGASPFTVKWQCTGACKGTKGTSTWKLKGR
jgi:hypothetical protein